MFHSTDLSLPAKEETLHVIFLFYFEQLASLPYRLRRKLHGDSYAKKMKRMIKQSDYSDRFDSYWSLFLTQCAPFFLLSMIGEIRVFQSHSYFFQIIGLTLFLIGFVFYIYFAYKLEGWRFLSSLYKWVRYRANHSGPNSSFGRVPSFESIVPITHRHCGSPRKTLAAKLVFHWRKSRHPKKLRRPAFIK